MSGFVKIVDSLHFNHVMPVNERKTEPSKKSPAKKGRKSKSKHKKSSNSMVNELTPENLSSLRWEYTLPDPALEQDRIERYKELRRQRYINAQQQTIEKLTEKKKISLTHS